MFTILKFDKFLNKNLTAQGGKAEVFRRGSKLVKYCKTCGVV